MKHKINKNDRKNIGNVKNLMKSRCSGGIYCNNKTEVPLNVINKLIINDKDTKKNLDKIKNET